MLNKEVNSRQRKASVTNVHEPIPFGWPLLQAPPGIGPESKKELRRLGWGHRWPSNC